MKPSHMVIKEAVDKVGAKAVALKLNISVPLLYKWCQDSKLDDPNATPSGAYNPLDRLNKIYEVTKDPGIINWVCEMANGYFVKNTSKDNIKCENKVFKNIQMFIKEFSETLNTISASYLDDYNIDAAEAKLIRREWEDLKRTGEGFVCACERGKFDKKGNKNPNEEGKNESCLYVRYKCP